VYHLLEFEGRSKKVEVTVFFERLDNHMSEYIALHSRKYEKPEIPCPVQSVLYSICVRTAVETEAENSD
jgi:hypothetical protein